MKIKSIISCIVLCGIVSGGIYGYDYFHYNKLLENEKNKVLEESKKQQLLEDAIDELNQKHETELSLKDDDSNALKQTIKDLENKIEELMVEEVYIVDAEMIEENIQDISELAVLEYRYTNVGVLDSDKVTWGNFSIGNKSAIVTCDGVIKVGIDFSEVTIDVNEDSKSITVTLPHCQYLTNELDENSFEVLTEDDSFLNRIDLDDSSELRLQIKEKSTEKANENKILEQGDEKVKIWITNIIESTPHVKDEYNISFKYDEIIPT